MSLLGALLKGSPLGRREHRRPTVHLHRPWGRDPSMRCSQTCLVALHRRPRCLFHQQRRTWGQHQPRKPRWHGRPFRRYRIGEASNPGPPVPGTPLGGEGASQRRRDRSLSPEAIAVDGVGAACRLYCPVPGCPSSDDAVHRGVDQQTNLDFPCGFPPRRHPARPKSLHNDSATTTGNAAQCAASAYPHDTGCTPLASRLLGPLWPHHRVNFAIGHDMQLDTLA